jgi:hypothetical protein
MTGLTREQAKECVGQGWHNLLNFLYDRLPPSVYVAQVKEKFGGLRFYADGVSEKMQELIEEIEDTSLYTCEVCGNEGKVRNRNGRLKTLCDVCVGEEATR